MLSDDCMYSIDNHGEVKSRWGEADDLKFISQLIHN